MKHLAHADLVDWLDGALPRDRAAHVDGCARCRDEAQALRQVLEQARQIAVPEPSPLFWDHLSARVNEGVAAAPRHDLARTAWVNLRAPLLAAAALCLVVGLALLRVSAPSDEDTTAPARAAVHQPGAIGSTAGETLAADDGWSLVQLVADDVPLQTVQDAGLVAEPGSAERVALELSPREQAELALLLRQELKGSGL